MAPVSRKNSAYSSRESKLKTFSAQAVSYLLSIALVTLLGACGGGGGGSVNGLTSGGGGGVTPPPPPSAASLTLTASTNAISPSTPATLTATLKNASGAAVAGTVVKFVTQGMNFGVFFPTGGTALTDASGVATISLNAGTMIGADSVTASATVGATAVVSSPLGFTVSAAPITTTAASITFVSASPTTIAIKGTGGQENSTVIFIIKDSNGNPLANQNVILSLTSNAGGVSLAAQNATSKADGTVGAILQAGTTATPVRVKAVLTSNFAVTGISSQLVVSTAIPHQDGFSIAATKLNIEALNVDGVTTTFTAHLSDRYGNLVPDGTAVSFRTEGGVSSINPSCQTSSGACSVTLASSGRRPFDGRLTVLATAIGEESFVDANGNGLYDIGEQFKDLPEAFIDGNEDGVRGINTTEPLLPIEEFVDFNNNGVYDNGDGQFNGVLRACDVLTPKPAGCPAPVSTTINVRSSLVIVLSGHLAVFGGLPSSVTLGTCGSPPTVIPLTISDINGNSLAGGTSVVITTTNGTILSPASFTIPDSNAKGPFPFPITLITDATLANGVCTNANPTGTLKITVTTPGNFISTAFFTVND